MAFYTIINLNDYKTNSNNGKIKLTDIFNDGQAQGDDIINSKNTDSYQGFYILDQDKNQQSFELKGRTIDQHITRNLNIQSEKWVTERIGNFELGKINEMKADIIANNKIGFGHGIGSNYQEFGDQIMPGPQSLIKYKDSAAFFVGIKGATGGGGAAGGGNEWNNWRGGGGGDGGGTYGVWVYPGSQNISTITEQQHATGQDGGFAGTQGGQWGWQKGYGGSSGYPANNTRLNFQHQGNDITFRITGGGGGGGGEGAGRGGADGGDGGNAYVDFQVSNVSRNTVVDASDNTIVSYKFLKSDLIPGGQGAPESGKSRSGGGGQKGDGSVGADGSGATFIYLAGSKNNHNS
jgi:hypothetical protein